MSDQTYTFQHILDHDENRLVFEDHLLPALKRGAVIPFVGAGMSVPCRFPSWTTFLKKEAARRGEAIAAEVEAHLDRREYEEAAQVLVDAIGSDTAMDGRLQTHFGKHRDRIDIDKAPVRHLPVIFHNTLITTNYDNVLEKAYQDHRLQVEAGASMAAFNASTRDDATTYLFKLHGRADTAQGRILTAADYNAHYGDKSNHERGFDPDKSIPSTLRRVFSANSVLFLGCSLAQDRTMLLLDDMMKRGDLPYLFALVGEERDVIAQRTRLDRWGIKAIYYPEGKHEWVETFLAGVVQALEGGSPNPR